MQTPKNPFKGGSISRWHPVVLLSLSLHRKTSDDHLHWWSYDAPDLGICRFPCDLLSHPKDLRICRADSTDCWRGSAPKSVSSLPPASKATVHGTIQAQTYHHMASPFYLNTTTSPWTSDDHTHWWRTDAPEMGTCGFPSDLLSHRKCWRIYGAGTPDCWRRSGRRAPNSLPTVHGTMVPWYYGIMLICSEGTVVSWYCCMSHAL